MKEVTRMNGRDNGKGSNASSAACDRFGTQPDSVDRPMPLAEGN